MSYGFWQSWWQSSMCLAAAFAVLALAEARGGEERK